jgi:hypothetical protein
MARVLAMMLLAFAAMWAVVDAIPTISVVGSKFFTSDGKQFYNKGEFFAQSSVATGLLTSSFSRHCLSTDRR